MARSVGKRLKWGVPMGEIAYLVGSISIYYPLYSPLGCGLSGNSVDDHRQMAKEIP